MIDIAAEELRFSLAGYVIENPDYSFGVSVPPSGSALEVPPQAQFLHGVAGFQAVDIYLTDFGADLSSSTPIASLAYPQMSPLLTLDAGDNYQLRVTPQGNSATVLFDSGLTTIALNTRVYVPLVKYFGDGGDEVSLLQVQRSSSPFVNASQPSEIEIVNLIADESSIDVYLGGLANAPTLSDVDFETRSPLSSAAEGMLNLAVDITPFNNNVDAIYQVAVNVFPGSKATLYLGGLASDEAQNDLNTVVGTLAFTDDRPVPDLDRIVLVHGSGSLGPVDVYLLGPGETTADKQASFVSLVLGNKGTVFIAPGDYNLVITRAGNDTELHGPEILTLSAGTTLEIVLSDTAGGGLPLNVDTVSTPLTPR
ncbi:MAG: DUF4397 domain-containing protein [Proteobacteria bacterium]|nr:DUF4397 domain-containing protein [Pseudomonadota bacterium]